MSDEGDEAAPQPTWKKLLAETAITLGVPALANAVGGEPAALAAGAASRVFWFSLEKHVEERQRDRSRRWTAGLALGLAEAGVGFDDLEDDDEFRDVIYQTVRAGLEALDPSVVPFLGRLAAWYRGRPLDPFFRGAVRTLRDLTGTELTELKRMMYLAASTAQLEAAFELESVQLSIGPDGYFASRGISDSVQLTDGPEEPDAWLRVWGLLSAHHLAERGRGADPMEFSHSLTMDLDDVLMFARLLAVSTDSAAT